MSPILHYPVRKQLFCLLDLLEWERALWATIYWIKRKCFATAKDNTPETQDTQSQNSVFNGAAVEDLQYSSVKFTVIDTPGLNESDAADLKHMIGIVEKLEKQSEIAACILVVKFNAKIDAQYRKTIEYYSRLLPSLFEKNVFVVMTDFAMDPRSVAMRRNQGINVDIIIENTAIEIARSANLNDENPMVFHLDCLPFSSDEAEYSEDVRSSIFEYIVQLQPIRLNNLTVAKTERLLQIDNEEIRQHEGEIDGYTERLIELNRQSQKVLNTIRKKESSVAELKAKISEKLRELNEKDTDELVTTATWSVDTEGKFARTQIKGCHLESKWKIANVRTWSNGKCKWTGIEQTWYAFKGRVVGKFSHGLYANVVLETEKRTKYAKDIGQLKKALEDAMKEYESEKKDLEAYSKKQTMFEADIANLEGFIHEKSERIHLLKGIRITISEAKERLQKMYDA